MRKGNNLNAFYNGKQEKLVLYDDTKELEKAIEGKVYINHETRLVRLYEFSKVELANKDKVNIIYSILEGTVLYPLDKIFKRRSYFDIENYVLLVNGYSINGEFIESRYIGNGKFHKSLATELIDNTVTYDGEPEFIDRMRKTVKASFKNFMEHRGMKELVIDAEYDDLMQGYKEICNMAKILKAYFRGKGFCINMVIDNKWLSNNKSIHILPLFKR